MNVMIDLLWKSSLLVALALCITIAARKWIAPKWRHAILLIALLRFALPFTPQAPFSIFNLTQKQEEPLIIESTTPQTAIPLPAPPRTREPQQPSNPATLPTTLWLTGSLLFLVRESIRITKLRRALREKTPILTRQTLDILDSAREILGVRRRITLATSDAVSTPSLLGIIRPTLLLPRDGETSLSAEQLRFIFLHEVAHLRRLDVVVNWFMAILQIVYWFNPLVWIAASRLAEERELACDALALENLTRSERSGYAETVIELLERAPMLDPVPALVGMTSTKQQLKRRILMIANFRSRTRSAIWPGALVLAFALVSLTDATAGEKHIMKMRHPLSPEAKAVMEKLDQKVSLTLTNVPVTDVLSTIQSATGVAFTIDKNALDASNQNVRIDLTADRVPAHLVLMESLASVGLGLDFNAEGATVVRRDSEEPGLPAAAAEDVVIIRKGHHDGALPEAEALPPALPPGARMIQVEKKIDKDANGVSHRTLTFRDGQQAQPDGTLDIRIH